jgi:hypothetical protein
VLSPLAQGDELEIADFESIWFVAGVHPDLPLCHAVDMSLNSSSASVPAASPSSAAAPSVQSKNLISRLLRLSACVSSSVPMLNPPVVPIPNLF